MSKIEYLLHRYSVVYNIVSAYWFNGIEDAKTESTLQNLKERLARKGVTDIEKMEQLSDYEAGLCAGFSYYRLKEEVQEEIHRLAA